MKQAVIPINGGLDLVSDQASVPQGTAQSCLNYEVGNVRGIRRIDGFSRWDGNPRLSFRAIYMQAIGLPSTVGKAAVGTKVTVSYTDVENVVRSVSAVIAERVVSVYDPNGGGVGVPFYAITVTLALLGGSDIVDTASAAVLATISGDGYQDTQGTAYSTLPFEYIPSYSLYSSLVSALPGDSTTRIPGLHFFKDKLYAVVDLVAMEVATINTVTGLLEGAELSKTSGGASFGTVGTIRPSTTAGNVIIEIVDFVAGTTFSSGQDIYIGTTQVADWYATATAEKAALYCADWDGAGGWTRVDLGRRVEYDEGAGTTDATAFFLPYVRRGFIDEIDANELQNSGWVGADSWDSIGGGQPWNSLGTAPELAAEQSIDGKGTVGASTVGTGNYTQTLRAFFSSSALNIPAGAVVRGVEVRIHRWKTGANNVYDVNVSISKTGGAGSVNKGRAGVAYPVAGAGPPYGSAVTYGADNDMWGLSISPAEINDGGFNVHLMCLQEASTSAVIDEIAVKVYYQDQTRKAYVYDSTQSPTDQEIEIVHYTVSEGSATNGTGDRRGVLVLNPSKTVPDDEKPWQFQAGQAIRTQSGGAGVVLAYLASDDEPIFLASSNALAAESSRYQFTTASPYARDDADVIFIVNGAEYAYMFDGTYALPIQTGLLAQYEKPRHAAWTGNYLALGYKTGSIAISDLGEPLTYLSTSSLAAEIGASDRVTGLLNLKGDSLGVFTERTIFAIQGSDSTQFVRTTISPDSGAIEYTVCDVGVPMFCDYRGISTIATTDQYGDFNRGRLSWEATPWLLDRLQSNRRNEAVDKTVVAALPIRNKNQYRVFFKDGWIATLTMQGQDSSEVAITTQRYYGDWQDRDVSAIRVLGLCAGVTSTGQDVAFMSFATDAESARFRYVFQIDAGRSFDGEEIIAQWMGQPLTLGGPFINKSYVQLGAQGKAYGYAALKVYAATEFTNPASEETTGAATTGYDVQFGTTASATEGNFKFIKSIRGEGEDITFLFESISATELPHTIQSIVVRYETLEAKR